MPSPEEEIGDFLPQRSNPGETAYSMTTSPHSITTSSRFLEFCNRHPLAKSVLVPLEAKYAARSTRMVDRNEPVRIEALVSFRSG